MKTYYHNISKDHLNESDLGDFLDVYERGDLVYKSIAGNACIEELKDEDIDDLQAYFDEQHEADAEEDRDWAGTEKELNALIAKNIFNGLS